MGEKKRKEAEAAREKADEEKKKADEKKKEEEDKADDEDDEEDDDEEEEKPKKDELEIRWTSTTRDETDLHALTRPPPGRRRVRVHPDACDGPASEARLGRSAVCMVNMKI